MACGAPLGFACEQCGTALPADARFCAFCGTSVSPGKGDSTETIKLVTVLFADVVGSTAQAEMMRPEDTRALMARFFDAMSEEIRAEGGTVERIIGDAIMADFGVPIAREDDPERAVRAARRMFERLDRFNADRFEGPSLGMRIGINTGAVSTGGSFGEQLLVMGDAVNVAARLEQAAPPGTILIGERTARAVRGKFRLGRAESVNAKGKTHPVRAFAVEEEVEVVHETALRQAALVGRTVEMQALAGTFERCRSNSVQQACTIIGDAGVGKSRLLAEFLASIEDEATVLKGRCPPYGDGLTLAPLQEILRSEARIFPQDDAEASFAKVVRLLTSVAPALPPAELLSTSAALGSTIGLSPALDSMADLDPRMIYREMLRAWRTFLSELARSRPVVVAIEDLHWADQTMLDVIRDLSQHIDRPVLLVCTARTEFVVARSEWLSELQAHSTINLDALSRHEAEHLVAELLGAAQLPSDLTERVLERAEGNPLFIEEFLLRLIDEGRLSQSVTGWHVTGDLSDIEVPERIQTLIQARLDLLSPLEREVLQAAAVVGRHFWSDALRSITGIPDADDVIDRLKPRQMVVEQFTSSVPGDIEYAFRHALIRDVVYEGLPRKTRARAHAATARWIESVRGDRADESAELLAEHYERAYEDTPDETIRASARHYLLLAARTALRRFAIDQAERLGYRLAERSVAGQEKVEALEALGDAFYLAMRGNPAWSAYGGALDELREVPPVDQPNFASLAAKAAMIPTRWIGTMDDEIATEDVASLIEAGLRAAGPGDSRERAMLLSARAFLAGTAEKPEQDAEGAAREAVAIAQRLDDPDLVSTAMDALAVLLWPTGRFGEISRVDRARLDLLANLSDVRERADILLSAGRDLGKLGQLREALDYLNRAAETVYEIDVGQYLHVLVQRSQVHFMSGDWDAALSDLAEIETLEIAGDRRIPPYAGRAYGVGFFCHHLRGEPAAARYLDMLRRYRDDIADAWSEASGPFAVPARALALRGQIDEALDWLSLDVSGFIRAEHLQALTDVVPMSANTQRAEKVLHAAREEAASAEMTILDYFADRLEGRMAAGAGNLDAAINLLERAAEGFGSLHARWEEAWSRLLLAELQVEAGRNAEAAHELARALPVFEDLRSAAELERGRALAKGALLEDVGGASVRTSAPSGDL